MWRRGDHTEVSLAEVWFALILCLAIFLPGLIFSPRVAEVIISAVFYVITGMFALFFLIWAILVLFDKTDWFEEWYDKWTDLE